jgi:hypothetical protein
MNNGYKKAALTIHGLGEVDRQWLLGNLPEKERNLLSNYLTQLSEMQIPAHHSVFSDLIDKESKTYANVSEPDDTGSLLKIELINGAGITAVTEILAREPDWMLALVLVSGEWKWTEEFINILSDHRRERVRELIEKLSLRAQPKLKEAVIDMLSRSLSVKTDVANNHAQSRLEILFRKYGTASVTTPDKVGELQ